MTGCLWQRLVAAGLLAAAMLIAPVSSGWADGRSFSAWFRHRDDVAATWLVSEVEGDPWQVEIRHRHPFGGLRPKRILVLYPRPSSAYDTAISKILEIFHEKNLRAEFRVFNFGRKDERGLAALRMAEDYDLIFSMGSESTAWLYENYRGGRVPVVTVCSKDPVELGQMPEYHRGSGNNFAFTSLNMPVEVQMAYVLELKPGLKNLGVLVDAENISAVQTQAEPISAYARALGIQVLTVAIAGSRDPPERLKRGVADAVEKMRSKDPMLVESVFWVTGSTAVFREIAAINDGADRVPVLSVVPEVVKAGDESAVLSIGVSFESNGHLAAIYGSEILLGRAKPGDLKVGIVSPPDIAINFRRARAIGLQIPFSFFEAAGYIYDYEGRPVRIAGKAVQDRSRTKMITEIKQGG